MIVVTVIFVVGHYCPLDGSTRFLRLWAISKLFGISGSSIHSQNTSYKGKVLSTRVTWVFAKELKLKFNAGIIKMKRFLIRTAPAVCDTRWLIMTGPMISRQIEKQ